MDGCSLNLNEITVHSLLNLACFVSRLLFCSLPICNVANSMVIVYMCHVAGIVCRIINNYAIYMQSYTWFKQKFSRILQDGYAKPTIYICSGIILGKTQCEGEKHICTRPRP